MIEFVKLIATKEEYYAYPALNYSTLKAFDGDPEAMLQDRNKASIAMDIGQGVDTLLFDGKEVFDEKFYTFTATRPTASLLVLAEAYIESMKLSKISSRDDDLAMGIIADLNLWSNIKKESTLLAKLTDEFWEYIEAVEEAGDKAVLDIDGAAKVGMAVNTLISHELTEMFYSEEEGVEKNSQLAIVFTWNNIEFKVMLDQGIIDHNNKTARPVDLKTLEDNANRFPSWILKWRYDLQAELYMLGFQAYIAATYPGYKVLPFKFVVISKQRLDKPFVYGIRPESWRAKLNINKIVPYRSISEIVAEFMWHSKKALWVYPREIYEKGYIMLD